MTLRLLPFALTFAALMSGTNVSAQTLRVWVGNGTNNGQGKNLLDTTNWAGNTINNGDDTEFGNGATSPQTVLISTSLSLRNLTFATNRPSYTFIGADSPTVMLSGNGKVVVTTGTDVSFQNTLNIALTGSHVIDVADSTLLVQGVVSGAGSITKDGSGTLNLSGANTYSGGTTINAGTFYALNTSGSATGSGAVSIGNGSTLYIGNGGTTPVGAVSSTITNNGTLIFNRNDNISYSGISGTGNIHQSGAGTLTFTGTNTFSTLHIQNGSVAVGAENALGTSGTVSIASTGTLKVENNQTLAGLTGPSTSTVAISNEQTLTINATSQVQYDGLINGGGALKKIGNEVLNLANANTYTGGTVIDAGIVRVLNTTGSGTGTGTVKVGANGALEIGGGQTSGAVSGNVETLSGATVTFSRSDNVIYGNVISGEGTVTKNGTGMLTLTGANTYSGSTAILGGTLAVDNGGSLGTGTLSINNNSTLRLNNASLSNSVALHSGRVIGTGSLISTSVGTNAYLSPGLPTAGSYIGTLNFQDLTLNGGGALEWNLQNPIGEAGTGWDLITVSNPSTLTISSTSENPFTLKLVSINSSGTPGTTLGFNQNQTYTWLLFNTNGIEGFDATNFQLDGSAFITNIGTGGAFGITQIENNLFLTFTPVPEPSTWVLMGTGAMLIRLRLRRRKA